MRNYKRKTNEKPFTPELYLQAQEMLKQGLSIRKIGAELGFDASTVRKRLKNEGGAQKLGLFTTTFTNLQEKDIVEHCRTLNHMFYGVSFKTLQILIFKYAEENKIRNFFNKEKGMAGKDYTISFMKRHKLSLRTARKTSVARKMGFNRNQVEGFFVNLESAYQKYKFAPGFIYNMDETGIQTVPDKLPKIVSDQGQKEVAKNVTDSWQSSHPGQVITVYHVAELFNRAYERTATIVKATASFRATGIFPLDPGVFSDADFLPSQVTDQSLEEDDFVQEPMVDFGDDICYTVLDCPVPEPSVLPQAPTSVLDRSPDEDFVQEAILDFGNDNCDSALDFPVPGPSRLPDPVLCTMSPGPVSTSPLVSVVSPADITPLPKATRRKRSGRSLKSTLLTSSPHKKALRDKKLQAERLVQEKEDRKIKNAMKRKDKLMMAAKQKKKPRRGLQFDSDDSFQSQSISSGTSVYESESDSDQNMEESSEWMVPPKRCIGEFRAVRYEEKLFPGVITGFPKTHATVSSMVKAGKLWKWPDRPDILDHEWGSVVSSIY
ncbi:unnamed protein product, partial [Iphiclides podalirius]